MWISETNYQNKIMGKLHFCCIQQLLASQEFSAAPYTQIYEMFDISWESHEFHFNAIYIKPNIILRFFYGQNMSGSFWTSMSFAARVD